MVLVGLTTPAHITRGALDSLRLEGHQQLVVCEAICVCVCERERERERERAHLLLALERHLCSQQKGLPRDLDVEATGGARNCCLQLAFADPALEDGGEGRRGRRDGGKEEAREVWRFLYRVVELGVASTGWLRALTPDAPKVT